MFVAAGEKSHPLAALAMPVGHAHPGDRGVGVAEMRRVVDVVHRSGDVVRRNWSESWHNPNLPGDTSGFSAQSGRESRDVVAVAPCRRLLPNRQPDLRRWSWTPRGDGLSIKNCDT